ncbi:MAG: glycogen synthase [Coprobacillus sp.]|nr:glycogen synthase [Coprobacillus sp.]
MKIAMVASEANPFAKTGGLGDVVYSLAKELTVLGQDVIIVLPFYSSIKDKLDTLPGEVTSYFVSMSWRKEKATIYRTYVDGITYYLIANDHYFGRRVMYGEYDDGERFAFFTLAATALFENIDFKPDIVHVHDWQAGMLPVLLKEKESQNEFLKDTKSILTIHNPAFQGLFPKTILGDFYGLPDSLYDSGKVRFNDQVSTLKSAIVYADKIITVSPTHAQELLTNDGGKGLDSILRLREWDFTGILNGVDYLEFNPETDDYIYIPYSVSDFKSGKDKNKAALLHSMHLKDTGKPLVGLVSRLTWQKGTDLIFAMAYELANKGCNLCILGSGEYQIEQQLEKLRATYPDTVGIYIGYNDDLAHKIYAASDLFLMPSLFEPCGIGQMIAQRYGSLPIVRRTGGLKDSVICFDGNNEDKANGFGFDDYDPAEAVKTADYAYETWFNLETRKKLMKNAMETDNSWRKSALKYLEVYHSLVPEDK